MIGRIAVHLSDDKNCARRIAAGVLLAKQRNAELIGIYPADGTAGYYYQETILPQSMRKTILQNMEEARETTRMLFLQETQAAGVKAQWRAPRGTAEESLALHARYCDLLIMSKLINSDDASAIMPNLPEAVMMAAGRPVLMLPNSGSINTLGERILYCWNQRREAARAFSDARPFLKSCKELVVLEVDRNKNLLSEYDLKEEDFSDYCVSLGYPKPRHLVQNSEGLGVGHVILNTASDTSADLIVMGAYGHSRMRQWIMSGASRTLLESMTIPVLLAH